MLQRLPVSLRQALPVAACGALALLVFRVRRTAGTLFLSILLLFATALAVLYLGYAGGRWAAPVPPRRPPARRERRSAPWRAWLAGGRFNRLEGTVVYVETLGGSRAEGLVAVRQEGAAPRLGYSPRVSAEWREGELRLRPSNPAGAGRPPLCRACARPREPAGAALFRAGTLAGNWAADARVLNAELELRFRRGKASFLVLGFALLFFLTTAFYLLRTARWPLLGAALGFLLLRGTFRLFAWFDGRLAGELRKLAPGAGWVSLLPVGLLLLAGTLLLLLALLRPSPAGRGPAGTAAPGCGPGRREGRG